MIMLAQPVVCTSICSHGDGAYKRYWLLMRRGGGPASQWPPPRAHYGGQHFAWLHLHFVAPQHSTRPHLALHSPEQLYCESETVAVCAHWQGDARLTMRGRGAHWAQCLLQSVLQSTGHPLGTMFTSAGAIALVTHYWAQWLEIGTADTGSHTITQLITRDTMWLLNVSLRVNIV